MKTIFKLLNNSRSKDHTRPHLMRVFSTGKRICSTNGRVMAVLNKAYASGTYHLEQKECTLSKLDNEVVENSAYPDVEKIIPETYEGYTRIETTIPNIKAKIKKYSYPSTYVHINKDGNFIFGNKPSDTLVSLNFIYLNDLAGEIVTIWVKGDNSPVVIENEGGFTNSTWFYMVMPVRE